MGKGSQRGSQRQPWRGVMAAMGASAVLGLASGPAAAAPVQLNFDFSLGDFIPIGTAAAPAVPAISGNFTVSFDTAVSVFDTTVGLTINALSFTPASPVAFSYFAAEKVLNLGGTATGSGSIRSGTDDFVLQIDLANLLAPAFSNCAQPFFNCGSATGNAGVTASAYSQAATPGFWFATSGRLTTNAVPEPMTLPLAAVAAAALWAVRRRRTG